MSTIIETISKKKLPQNRKFVVLEICCTHLSSNDGNDDEDMPSVKYVIGNRK
jgi:hypothetical protein